MRRRVPPTVILVERADMKPVLERMRKELARWRGQVSDGNE